jgi:hypothetical protein
MPTRERAQIIDPFTATADGEQGPYPFDLYERQLLAQGDSWFSIGALPPTRTTRVLAELKLLRSTVIVNCAKPGAVLHRMTNTTTEQAFLRLLRGRTARKWHAILLSGSGNDLIEAVGAPLDAPPAQRLLRTPAERGPGPLTGAGYISEDGWETFARHIAQVFNAVVDERDRGINRETPLIWHNYARVMPTRVGAGAGFGPWLLPALELYQVPADDHLKLSDELIARLGQLVQDIVAARQAKDPESRLHVVDSQSAGLELAAADATGPSGDWENEIHPTKPGYVKVAMAWEQVLDPILA